MAEQLVVRDVPDLASGGADHDGTWRHVADDDRAGRDDRAGAELERRQRLPLRGRARRQRWLLADYGVVEDLAAVSDHSSRVDNRGLGNGKAQAGVCSSEA